MNFRVTYQYDNDGDPVVCTEVFEANSFDFAVQEAFAKSNLWWNQSESSQGAQPSAKWRRKAIDGGPSRFRGKVDYLKVRIVSIEEMC